MSVDDQQGGLRDGLLGNGGEEDVVSEWAADQRTANATGTLRGMGGGSQVGEARIVLTPSGGWSVAGTEHGPAFEREDEELDQKIGTTGPRRRRFAEGTGTMRAIVTNDPPLLARGSSRNLRTEPEAPETFPDGTVTELMAAPDDEALLEDGTLDLDLDIADGVGLELDTGEDDEPAASLKRVRRRTKRSRPRSKTIAMKRVTRAELQAGALMYPVVDDIDRPKTRAQCKQEARPCPWVSCKHHLYLDINPETGSIKINFPDLEPWEMTQTCSLDVADEGALTLEEIGVITNLTRERIRQLEVRGLLKLKGRREIR